MIDEIAKDNENDQSNQWANLLCVLHLALTSSKAQAGGEPPYGFAFRTPEGSDTLGIAARHLPTHPPQKSSNTRSF
jgi:hypothetical protein